MIFYEAVENYGVWGCVCGCERRLFVMAEWKSKHEFWKQDFQLKGTISDRTFPTSLFSAFLDFFAYPERTSL